MENLLEKLEISEEEAEKEVEREWARRRLLDFTKYTFPDTGSDFLGENLTGYQANWHHEVLCNYLDWFLNDPNFTRLMIFMPPQYGKSELVSRRLSAFALGKNPNLKIIAASYSADLTALMNRDVQRIIETPQYQELFPNTQLYKKNIKTTAQGAYLKNSEVFEIVNHMGGYKCAGIGGGITGWGFDLGILDDLYSNFQEANSPTVRKTVSNWYKSTFYTRRRSGKRAKIIFITTRWHEDDLAGELIAQQKADPNLPPWVVLNFPAIAEEGNKHPVPEDKREPGMALWPLKEDKETLLATKGSIGTYIFTAMYQGNPSPAEGNIFNRSWWKYYKERPSQFDEQIQSWDCAFKNTVNSSYVCGQVWGRVGANKYLLDQVRDKMDFPTTTQAIKNLSAKWPQAYTKLVEDKANGPAVIATLKTELTGLIPVNPEGGKVVRAHAISGDIEAGNVYLPAPSISFWINDFVDECAAFPHAAYSDQVDAMSQAITRLRLSPTGITQVFLSENKRNKDFRDRLGRY
ncbi:MAG: phage terminase large subunit [Candidatus Eremiobacterota bacterium]